MRASPCLCDFTHSAAQRCASCSPVSVTAHTRPKTQHSAVQIRKLTVKARKALQGLPPLQGLEGARGLAARHAIQATVAAIRSCSELLAQSCGARTHACVATAVLGAACQHVEAKVLAMQVRRSPERL